MILVDLSILDEPYSNDDINSLVEDWCESEPSGMNYGYDYEWWFVEDDKLLIQAILHEEIKNIEREIISIEAKKYELEDRKHKVNTMLLDQLPNF